MTAAYPLPTTAPLSALGSIDVTNARFKADPFPFYARLRAEAPVFPVTIRLRGKQRATMMCSACSRTINDLSKIAATR
jgi:cytochrome P450 PksS